jgi:hypothetical protein
LWDFKKNVDIIAIITVTIAISNHNIDVKYLKWFLVQELAVLPHPTTIRQH